MIRTLSLILTFSLFLLTAGMTLAENSSPPERTPTTTAKTPETNIAPVKIPEESPVLPSDVVSDKNLEETTKEMLKDVTPDNKVTVMRISWPLVTGAVKYQINFDDQEFLSYTNGIEVPVDNVNKIFRITALDFDGNIITKDLNVTNVEINPKAPKPTTEFDRMDYAPLYPVYSWVPFYNADSYEIQLIKDGEIIRNYQTDKVEEDEIYDFYDNVPLDTAGRYYWRLRAMKYGIPISNWSEESEPTSFKVTSSTKIAALGDSITHGGGAVSAPPSMVIYDWETYCDVPVKNLGHSGDTTDAILARFENDVLPFQPKILVIMAGVNDYRGTILGWHTVTNYKALIEKCKENGITPVFVTPTPVSPALIKKVGFIEPPPYDWQEHYHFICDWIRKQERYIDITSEFEDEEGNLKTSLTTDGLHPDREGKRIIGRAVNAWLRENMDYYIN